MEYKKFGELTPEEKIELFSHWAHGGKIERYSGRGIGWNLTYNPKWLCDMHYRKAETKADELDELRQLYVKKVLWGSAPDGDVGFEVLSKWISDNEQLVRCMLDVATNKQE